MTTRETAGRASQRPAGSRFARRCHLACQRRAKGVNIVKTGAHRALPRHSPGRDHDLVSVAPLLDRSPISSRPSRRMRRCRRWRAAETRAPARPRGVRRRAIETRFGRVLCHSNPVSQPRVTSVSAEGGSPSNCHRNLKRMNRSTSLARLQPLAPSAIYAHVAYQIPLRRHR